MARLTIDRAVPTIHHNTIGKPTTMSDTSEPKILIGPLTEADVADPKIEAAIKLGEMIGMITAAKHVENTLNQHLTMKEYDRDLYDRMEAAIADDPELTASEKTMYATSAALFECACRNAKADGVTSYAAYGVVQTINDTMKADVSKAAADAEGALRMRAEMEAHESRGNGEPPARPSGDKLESGTDEEIAKFFAQFKRNDKLN
jgi:hypothetical protein